MIVFRINMLAYLSYIQRLS